MEATLEVLVHVNFNGRANTQSQRMPYAYSHKLIMHSVGLRVAKGHFIRQPAGGEPAKCEEGNQCCLYNHIAPPCRHNVQVGAELGMEEVLKAGRGSQDRAQCRGIQIDNLWWHVVSSVRRWQLLVVVVP